MRPVLYSILCLLAMAAPVMAFESRTKGVRDGDSIDVVNAEGAAVAIRLYGIDAPEAKQAFGFQARKQLVKLVSRKNVRIEVVDTDRYGRNVALVRLADGTLVNAEMLRAGLAWVYEQYCQREDVCELLRQAQAEARAGRRGLWAEDAPTPPWEWRRANKVEEWYAAPVRVMKKIASKIKFVIR